MWCVTIPMLDGWTRAVVLQRALGKANFQSVAVLLLIASGYAWTDGNATASGAPP